jgi:hypothetical protein
MSFTLIPAGKPSKPVPSWRVRVRVWPLTPGGLPMRIPTSGSGIAKRIKNPTWWTRCILFICCVSIPQDVNDAQDTNSYAVLQPTKDTLASFRPSFRPPWYNSPRKILKIALCLSALGSTPDDRLTPLAPIPHSPSQLPHLSIPSQSSTLSLQPRFRRKSGTSLRVALSHAYYYY